MVDSKDTNPKDLIGSTKPGLFCVPSTSLFHLGEAHRDGARKYGPFNWREGGVRASIYLEAFDRHVAAWKEGEQVAPDSGCHHLAHAMACLSILLDAEACGVLQDDRPPPAPVDWMNGFRDRAAALKQGSEPTIDPDREGRVDRLARAGGLTSSHHSTDRFG